MPERRTHDYVGHGVTSLFAAFNIADGTVISALHRRHRASHHYGSKWGQLRLAHSTTTAPTRPPTPFLWIKTAEQILESLGRLLARTSGAGH